MIINWGDAPFKAFITVTYPRGSCTVSGNGQTYGHSGGGTTTFTVKKKGTYTVKIVTGSLSKSSSVEISKLGETKTVSLNYRTYFYNRGSQPQGTWQQRDTESENDVSFESTYIRLQGDPTSARHITSPIAVPVDYVKAVVVGYVDKSDESTCFYKSGLCDSSGNIKSSWNIKANSGDFKESFTLPSSALANRYIRIEVQQSYGCLGRIYEVYVE